MDKPTCSTDGCSKPRAAKGLCKTHHAAARRAEKAASAPPKPKRECAICGTDITDLRSHARVCRNSKCKSASASLPPMWVVVEDKQCTVVEDGERCPNKAARVVTDGRWCSTHAQRYDRYGTTERQWKKRLKPGEPLAIITYAATLGPEADCYLRLGSDNNRWTVNYNGRMMTAARAVYMIRHQTDPGERAVLHTCHQGHEGCITGGHLCLGDQQQNIMECVEIDRCSLAKLTNEQAREIKNLHRRGAQPGELARLYGVSYYAIWKIVTGRTWKHLP